jgi:putative hemolysin
MVPLPQVAMAERGAERADLLELLRERRFSRIPVYEGQRANVVGMVNILDVASAPEAGIARIMREPLKLPRWTSVADALWTLRQARQQLAVVVDPAGRAVGIVTVKDLVEEIVGELEAW